jgi:nicotinate phosphoribosyltransferase
MFLQVAALKGYEHANTVALDLWEEIYPDQLFYTVTDTFTTGAFFKARTLALLIQI